MLIGRPNREPCQKLPAAVGLDGEQNAHDERCVPSKRRLSVALLLRSSALTFRDKGAVAELLFVSGKKNIDGPSFKANTSHYRPAKPAKKTTLLFLSTIPVTVIRATNRQETSRNQSSLNGLSSFYD